MFYIFYYFLPRVHPLISSATAHYFAQQWHWGGTNSSNIRTGSRCPLLSMMCLMHPPFAKYLCSQAGINNFRRYLHRYNNNTNTTFIFIFFVIYHLHLCFTFRFMFADDSGTAGDRWVRVFFIFPQQRVSQLIFLPLADEWEVGGSGRSGAAAAARPGQRYVRVIANCLFIFDIVSHIIICLSPHPQADGNENGKQEVGGGSRVVGGGEGHGGR